MSRPTESPFAVSAEAPRRSLARQTADPRDDLSPVRARELLAVLVLVILCDLTIYRGRGFAGCAALFTVAPLLLAWGAYRPRLGRAVWFVGLLLALLAVKSLWCGSPLLVACGFALLAAFAMTLSGQTPYVAETAVFASLAISAGYRRLNQYGKTAAASSLMRVSWLNLTMPLAALAVFSAVFVLANPDLLASVSELAEHVAKQVREWLLRLSVIEIGFWAASGWLATGLLRQATGGAIAAEPSETDQPEKTMQPSRFYPAFRNTLVTVIALFAVYLLFEFRTLWFREFPTGFYYSGYAHEGAAWLTFALALATAVMSLVFRGSVLRDPRLRRLRTLGWIWSAENFVLAAAVYHRMAIYIDFNGMSPMRMIGLYGMSAVVLGFLLVNWKIARARSFGWLVRRQLLALALVVYLYALTPVDAIVTEYNVRQILAGDPAPSVQISVHPISAEGVLLLAPLLDCDDTIIREGIGAMLAQRDDAAQLAAHRRRERGWTAYQLADEMVANRLRAGRPRSAEYQDRALRDEALSRFHDYAYQWY